MRFAGEPWSKITQVVGAGGASRRGRESPRYRRRQMLRRNEIPAHLCWAPSECSPRGITRRTRPTRGAIHARSIHSTSSDRASRPTRTSVQLQSTNAQTPPKTGKYQRPESKTIQQLAEPDEICKTSTPAFKIRIDSSRATHSADRRKTVRPPE